MISLSEVSQVLTNRLIILFVADVLKDGHQVVHVVTVDGPHVVVPQLLEQRTPGHHPCFMPHKHIREGEKKSRRVSSSQSLVGFSFCHERCCFGETPET